MRGDRLAGLSVTRKRHGSVMKEFVEVVFDQGATRTIIGPAKVQNANDNSDSPCVSPLDDKNSVKKLNPQELQRWRRLAIIVCIISMYITFVLSGAAFVSSVQSRSSAAFAIAFDALLAIVSSSVVVWRFCRKGEVSDCFEKERRACLIIAWCFIVSAILISGRAVATLIEDEIPRRPDSVLIMAVINTVCYFLLFIAKYFLAEKLQSSALRADSIDAITGSATSFGCIISTVIFEEDSKAWFVDASFAIVIGVFTFIYGAQLLFQVIRMKGKESSSKPESYEETI